MTNPIRTIHILGSREFGGAEHFMVRLMRALHQAGHPVTAVCRADSPLARELRHDPIEMLHLPLANGWDAWSWWRIRQIVARRQPCVVQTYMGRATRLARIPKNSPAVHVARLGGFYKINGYYRHADAWVGISQAICEHLLKSGLPNERVAQIGHFIPQPAILGEAGKTALRESLHVPDNAWILFALGRMVPKKGFQDLLDAIAMLPADVCGRPVVLMLAGDGPELKRLQAHAEACGIASRVRFLGWQDTPDHYYQIADVFVCPSRHEPLGCVFLEAWNHSLPIVGTRSHGALELIEEGATGLLCDCRDVAGMAGALRRMLEASDADRRKMAAAGNACLHERYGQERIVDAYLTLYRDLLSEKTRR